MVEFTNTANEAMSINATEYV